MEEKSTGRGFLILSFANIAGKVLSMIYSIILINILGDTGQGLHTKSYSVYIFLLAVTSTGVQPAITKVITELRALGNNYDAYRAMKISKKYLSIFGGLTALALIALAQPIADIINASDAALAIMALAPAIFFVSILSADRAYLQSIGDMKTLGISQILEQIVNIVINITCSALLIGIGLKYGVAGGTIGATIGAAITLAYIMFVFNKNKYKEEALNQEVPKKVASEKKIMNRLIKYGIPIILVAALQNAGGLIDSWNVTERLIFSGIAINDDAANGLYGILNRYNTLLYVPLAIVTALSVATFPKIIQAFAQKSKKDIKLHMNYAFRLTYMITIPASIGLSILSSEIYRFLFPSSKGHELIMYGSVVLIFMSITQIQNTILQGVNKQYIILATAGLGLIIKFILNYILVGITSINILGAVIASFFGFGIQMILNHRILQKTFRVRIPMLKQSIVPLLCSGVMAGGIYVLKFPAIRVASILGSGRVVYGVMVSLLGIIGVIIYGICMIYTGGIRKKDLESISPKIFLILPKFLREQMR